VTESSAFKNYVLYFRQDDWDVLSRPLVDSLASKTFRKIAMTEVLFVFLHQSPPLMPRVSQTEVQEVLKQRRLSYSFVRLLPKETGVRPVVNLRRAGQGGKSINQLLQAAFQILNYEKVCTF
jgi:telomerase reverse transcriptase